jgi:hypothetical protein
MPSQGSLTDVDSGESHSENTGEQSESTSVRRNLLSKFSKKQKIAAILMAIILLVSLGSVGLNKFSEVQEKNRIAAEEKAKADAEAAAFQAELDAYSAAVKDNSWVPSGFYKFPENPYLAYKRDGRSCASYGMCFPFELVTNKYCSSVYISANLTSNGTIVDFTNDTANGVSPGTLVKMKLQWTEDYGDNTDFIDVNCR